MKQNTRAIHNYNKYGQFGYQHLQVTVDYWSIEPTRKIEPTVWEKTWGRWQLIYTVGGRGQLTWPGGKLAMEPRMATLLSPFADHTFHTDPELRTWRQYLVTFLPRSYWHKWLRWPEIAPGIAMFTVTGDEENVQLRQAFLDAYNIGETPRALWEEFTMVAVERILMMFHSLNPLVSKKPSSSEEPALDPRLQDAIEFIEKNHDKPITCSQIAHVVGISRAFLGTLFRQYLRATPQQYLETFRINKAQRLLLKTDKSISEIGYMSGYPNRSHFCRRFRKRTGQTPTEFRRVLK